MKFSAKDPPRIFEVGRDGMRISLKDCGWIQLDADEQVTFLTEQGGEYDLARKSWGFYATPSLNARLPRFGLRAALTKSADGKFFIKLVEKGREADFEKYMKEQDEKVVTWLDSSDRLETLEKLLSGEPD
jgi:hypothetical protein